MEPIAGPVIATWINRPPVELRIKVTAGETYTDRQREVLALVAAEYSNKEIAAALGITQDTARGHISDMMRRSGATSRVGLVVRAVASGGLSIESRTGTTQKPG